MKSFQRILASVLFLACLTLGFSQAVSTVPSDQVQVTRSLPGGTTTYPTLRVDALGYVQSQTVQHFLFNSSTAVQVPVATTRTYITGSQLSLSPYTLRVGTIFRWHFNMTKTAAGVATSTIDIAFGIVGTTTDVAQVSFSKPAGTAAVDEGWVDVECVIKTINASTGVAVGEFRMGHNLAATGHAQIPIVAVNTTSASFDTTTPTFVGLCITTGAADAITITQVSAEAINL